MTAYQFAALCGEMTIDPAVALECDEVRNALQADGGIDNVKQALIDNF